MKPVLLFLGAGASATRQYPTVDHFFEHLKSSPGSGFERACQEIARLIDVAEGTSEGKNWPRYNAERIFGKVEELAAAEKFSNPELKIRLPNARGDGVKPSELCAHLKKEIIRIYGRPPQFSLTPPPGRDPLGGLFSLMDETTPPGESLRMFTTNYDTLVEQFFNSESDVQKAFGTYRPKLYTGFSSGTPGTWNPSIFDEPPKQNERVVHLVKLHGSTTWKYRQATLGQTEVVETGWGEPTGEYDCVLYFGYKSVPESEPFKTLHSRLKDALLSEITVIAIGFRFADPYIRETFDFALRANHKLSIISCVRSTPPDGTPVRELAKAYKNRFVFLRSPEGDPLLFGQHGFCDALRKKLREI